MKIKARRGDPMKIKLKFIEEEQRRINLIFAAYLRLK
jgi:hypothetical protein